MSRFTVPLCVCALLSLAALPQAAESGAATEAALSTTPVGRSALVGANAACADANSDYERYELGCPSDDGPDPRAFLND